MSILEGEWEPMVTMTQARRDFLVSPALSSPFMMRRRVNGAYQYREPTEAEIVEFQQEEGWR